MVAHRNTDLLPLAKTLMALGDELTEALLPTALSMPQHVEQDGKLHCNDYHLKPQPYYQMKQN
jgi:hypothetical protein